MRQLRKCLLCDGCGEGFSLVLFRINFLCLGFAFLVRFYGFSTMSCFWELHRLGCRNHCGVCGLLGRRKTLRILSSCVLFGMAEECAEAGCPCPPHAIACTLVSKSCSRIGMVGILYLQ
ncbi:hypothetical protein M758_1G118700 [Ceratodon purpureus]|nr:hypothetical protein M758_1G118700 [Ceratodon purpureus]